MTTTPVMTITDEQIAEIEVEARWCSRASISAEVESDKLLALISRLRAAEKDAGRYRWLRERYYAADFSYGASDGFGTVEAMVFRMPEGHIFTAGCDQTIDAAMEQSK